MRSFGRSIIAVIVGVIVALAAVAGVESFGNVFFPVPAAVDFTDSEQVLAYMQAMPTGALLLVIAAWLIATFVGGSVAALIDPQRPRLVSGVVGAVVLAATVANLVLLPHPLWVVVTGVVGIVLVAYITGRVMGRDAATGLRSRPDMA